MQQIAGLVTVLSSRCAAEVKDADKSSVHFKCLAPSGQLALPQLSSTGAAVAKHEDLGWIQLATSHKTSIKVAAVCNASSGRCCCAQGLAIPPQLGHHHVCTCRYSSIPFDNQEIAWE